MVEHAIAVGEDVDDGEVVLMNRVAKPNSLLQLREQLEHPGLHRDVERLGRLVGDEQLRVERERAREARPAGAGRRRARAG